MERTTDRKIILKDRRTLGYAEYGDPMGAPIMLFHGTPGSKKFEEVAQKIEPQSKLLRTWELKRIRNNLSKEKLTIHDTFALLVANGRHLSDLSTQFSR